MSRDSCEGGRIHDGNGYDRGQCMLCKGSGCSKTVMDYEIKNGPKLHPLTRTELLRIKERWHGTNLMPRQDIKRLIGEVHRLREALDWYATADYEGKMDGGARAREALKDD